MSPLSILTHATRRCWDEWISVVLVSALWLAAQALVVTGPPATAALFAAARNTGNGVYWGAADLWGDFRALFVPAWKWGLLNLLVIGPALYNLSVFWAVPGVWQWLRPVWLLGLLVWLGLNLFYWPLWLAADDKSMRNTYANCIRFWLLHPVAALVLFAVCLAAALLLMPFALPIMLGVVFWIALVAQTAVRRSLEGMTADRDG